MFKNLLSICLLMVSFNAFAQVVFEGDSGQTRYLSLGSGNDHQIKVLNMGNGQIQWLDDATLQQAGLLESGAFAEALFSKSLFFHAQGYEPFWDATLKPDALIFQGGEEDGNGKELHRIQIDLNRHDLNSYSFLLMFQSEDKTVYGIIRGLSGNDVCAYSLDEEQTRFEVFLNNRGRLYSGYATLQS